MIYPHLFSLLFSLLLPQLATALRKGPYQTNILLAGYDENAGTDLYWMDYLGNMSKVKFGAHGYAGAFISSVFDREYKENMTEEEGVEVIKKCIHELKSRFLISQPNFMVKVVSKDGIKTVEL
jgi:20S proteasome subunit beta 4